MQPSPEELAANIAGMHHVGNLIVGGGKGASQKALSVLRNSGHMNPEQFIRQQQQRSRGSQRNMRIDNAVPAFDPDSFHQMNQMNYGMAQAANTGNLFFHYQGGLLSPANVITTGNMSQASGNPRLAGTGQLFSPQNNAGTANDSSLLEVQSVDQRGQKEVIVRRKSSKTMIRPETPKNTGNNSNQFVGHTGFTPRIQITPPQNPVPQLQPSQAPLLIQDQNGHIPGRLSMGESRPNREQLNIPSLSNDNGTQAPVTDATTAYLNSTQNYRPIGSQNYGNVMQRQGGNSSNNQQAVGQPAEQSSQLQKKPQQNLHKIHTLGGTLGNNQANNVGSLNSSQQFGGVHRENKVSLANRTALGKAHLNLTSLLKQQNLLEEEGIEDMHFHFVSFNQHRNSILKLHENIQKSKAVKGGAPSQIPSGHKKGRSAQSVPRVNNRLDDTRAAQISSSALGDNSGQQKTIDFLVDEEEFIE